MTEMSTADFLNSFGTRPVIINVPPTIVDKWAHADPKKIVEAELWALTLLGNASGTNGWTNRSPTDIRPEPVRKGLNTVEKTPDKMHPQHIVTMVSTSDYLGVLIVDISNKGAETALAVTNELASSMMGVAFTTGALVSDSMLNLYTPIPVPGMRVELTGAPTAVILRSRTGKVVREDEDDDYVIVRLDTPALYRHANGEVEELPEIVVMTDNLRVLGF